MAWSSSPRPLIGLPEVVWAVSRTPAIPAIAPEHMYIAMTHPADVDAGEAGRRRIAADGIDRPSEVRVAHDDVHDRGDHHEHDEHDRDARPFTAAQRGQGQVLEEAAGAQAR